MRAKAGPEGQMARVAALGGPDRSQQQQRMGPALAALAHAVTAGLMGEVWPFRPAIRAPPWSCAAMGGSRR
jgi:hypothetical protein